jgi:hypothetical protein
VAGGAAVGSTFAETAVGTAVPVGAGAGGGWQATSSTLLSKIK